jgi:hypothetical protein
MGLDETISTKSNTNIIEDIENEMKQFPQDSMDYIARDVIVTMLKRKIKEAVPP